MVSSIKIVLEYFGLPSNKAHQSKGIYMKKWFHEHLNIPESFHA